MRNVSVYTLSDPRTSTVRYVGITVQKLSNRLRLHLRYEGKDAKSLWIRSLLHEGVTPTITEIEVVPEEEKGAAEQRWVRLYREQGADLVNGTDGGLGSPGFKHSDEAKAEMSKARIGRASPMKGRTHSEEAREKIRQAAVKQFQDPAQREEVSKVHKGKIISEKHRQAVSEANTKRWEEWRASGQTISDETREKIRTAARNRKPRAPYTDEQRARMSEARRQWWAEKKLRESGS